MVPKNENVAMCCSPESNTCASKQSSKLHIHQIQQSWHILYKYSTKILFKLLPI